MSRPFSVRIAWPARPTRRPATQASSAAQVASTRGPSAGVETWPARWTEPLAGRLDLARAARRPRSRSASKARSRRPFANTSDHVPLRRTVASLERAVHSVREKPRPRRKAAGVNAISPVSFPTRHRNGSATARVPAVSTREPAVSREIPPIRTSRPRAASLIVTATS